MYVHLYVSVFLCVYIYMYIYMSVYISVSLSLSIDVRMGLYPKIGKRAEKPKLLQVEGAACRPEGRSARHRPRTPYSAVVTRRLLDDYTHTSTYAGLHGTVLYCIALYTIPCSTTSCCLLQHVVPLS